MGSDLLLNSLEQSLVFFPLVMGIFLTFGILRVTDLTVDGTYILGASVFAKIVTSGYSPEVAFLISALSGGFVGVCVAIVQIKGRINALLSGVLAVFMLYSVNLLVLGKPNISLLHTPTLMSRLSSVVKDVLHIELSTRFLLLSVIIPIVATVAMVLHSKVGLCLRAFGSNKKLVTMLGKTRGIYLILGLFLGNGLAASSGALFAQVSGFADINMGIGIALIGITTVVVSQHLFTFLTKGKPFPQVVQLTFCFTGAFMYFLLLNTFASFGVPAIFFNLLLGTAFLLGLSLTQTKQLGEV